MATQTGARPAAFAPDEAAPAASRLRLVAEVLMVAALPLLAYFVLRLQLMPLPDINDPAMHATYIVDPRDFFERYSDLLTPTARLREGARVGFLVPARVTYLLFGPVGGFAVLRYVFALVAIGPAYLLFRRLAGVAAGVTAAALILTCPVIITAWGTDYPDSASVSYLVGGLAFLALPGRGIRWAVAGVVLLTLSVWAFASSLVFAGIFAAVYLALRWWRARDGLWRDLVVAGAVSAGTTLVLMAASAALIGQLDFIRPTISSIRFLSQPSQEALWHSTSWAWAPFETYLLVLPVVALAVLLAFGRDVRSLSTPHLMVGASFLLALGAVTFLQFVGKVQMLEEHYFSSLSWAGAMLALCLVLVAVGRRLFDHPVWRWSVPALVVGIALAYEAIRSIDPGAFAISGVAYIAIGAVVLIALAVALPPRVRSGSAERSATLALFGGFLVAILLVTIAPVTSPGQLPGVVFSPTPQFARALGGGDERAIDIYQVSAELPGFVGRAEYPGERLVMWWAPADLPNVVEPIGMFHAFYNSIPSSYGRLDSGGAQLIEQRRPALVLLMSTTGDGEFPSCLAALGPYQPRLVKTGVLSSGSYALHVWLIRLDSYSR